MDQVAHLDHRLSLNGVIVVIPASDTSPPPRPSGRSIIGGYAIVGMFFLAIVGLSHPRATITLLAFTVITYAVVQNIRVILRVLRVEGVSQ